MYEMFSLLTLSFQFGKTKYSARKSVLVLVTILPSKNRRIYQTPDEQEMSQIENGVLIAQVAWDDSRAQ